MVDRRIKKTERKQEVILDNHLVSILSTLRETAAAGRLPHAIIFWGSLPSANKDAFVVDLAFTLLNMRRKIKQSKFSELALSGAIPDFIVLRHDPEQSKEGVTVRQIESLDEELPLYPVESDNRVIYLPNAELLTLGAQNALLKKLEEPSRENYFILSLYKPRFLLRTILSRCLLIHLPAENKNDEIDVENYLPQISNREEAQKVISKIRVLFETNPAYGILAVEQIRRILGEPSPLSEEERFLAAALAISPYHPSIASKMIALTLNPQKLSLDALFHYTFVDDETT